MSFDVQRLVSLGRVTTADLSPDGGWLAVEVGFADEEAARYRSQLWRVPLAGGAPERLLRGRFHDTAPRFRVDGALAFLTDRTDPDHGDDDEAEKEAFRQVWLLHPDGRVEQATDEALGVTSFALSDTHRLVCSCPVLPDVPRAEQRDAELDRRKRGPSMLVYDEMPVRFWDHWVPRGRTHYIRIDPDGTAVDLTPDAGDTYREGQFDLSRDGTILVTTRRRTGALRLPEHAIEVFDLEEGIRRVLGAEPHQWLVSPRISPDGDRVACCRTRIDRNGMGRHFVHILDLSTSQGRDVTTHWDRWPAPVDWIDAHTVLASADDAGSVPVFAVDLRADTVARLTPEKAAFSGARVHGDHIVAIRSSLLAPPEVVRVPAAGGRSETLTSLAGVEPEELAALAVVEELQVTASDGVSVPVFVVHPREQVQPRPGLVWIHGGPRSQWGQVWHWRWNSLIPVCAGYPVALPNPRGSTGLGQDFVHGIWGNRWGDQCYRDVLAATEAFAALDGVDGARLCAMGGSFGGYMTNWIGTQTDRFRCLVTHASIVSFHQFHLTTDFPAFWANELGSPWEGDRDAWERYSPDRYLDRWSSPVLILHGEKDYRVPVAEALALFEGLVRHGVQAELAVFPDENHWILKPRNIVAWYGHVLGFLARHLDGSGQPSSPIISKSGGV